MDINKMSYDDTLDIEKQMIEILINKCRIADDIADWDFAETDKVKSKYARADGILIKNKQIEAVVENRGRYNVKWDYIVKEGTWLLTEAKLLANIKLSELLQVPFIFCGYFPNEGIYAHVWVTNRTGDLLIKYNVRETWAKKNKNTDEKVKKRNAYIPIDQFRVSKL